MALDDQYDLSNVQNYTEELVYQILEERLNRIPNEDICKCETCVIDMACLALNQLPPRYKASLMGTIYSKAVDDEMSELVMKTVDESIAKISLNPGHK